MLPVALLAALMVVVGLAGCGMFPSVTETSPARFDSEFELSPYDHASLQIETPPDELSHDDSILNTAPPIDITSAAPEDFRDLRLDEAMQIALAEAKVLRDLGGLVLRSPENMSTVHDPGIQETDPRFGVEAALSAFDASFATSTFAEKNDRQLNNTFFGGGTRKLKQDAGVYQTQFSKIGATGTEYILRNNVDYDANNAPGNLFPSAWNTNVEVEFRHPLLQGSGLRFNRIAGPGATEGLANGVLIARVNTDISLADFEMGVTQFVSDVENAYWDLYYAYRDLDAKITARDSALKSWRTIRAWYETGRRGGEEEKEAQAKEQYFRLEEEVQNALNGRLIEGTRSNNGSSGGTFRGTGGVYVAERRLRLLLGLNISDGKILRPISEPGLANVEFDWETTLAEAIARRPEIRRQKWLVKRRQLELEAARNYLKPQLDVVGRWRFRGFGRDLMRQHRERPDATNPNNILVLDDANNAFESMFDGEFQEWQAGFEMTIPIGFRRAHAAVRNAELRLSRERTLLREQEREIVHNLSNAVGEKRRAYKAVQVSFNRRLAAKTQYDVLQQKFDDEQLDNQELLMSAQRRLAEADASHHKAVIEYSLAIKNVHYEKGSLLDFNQVFLSEGEWPLNAYQQSEERRQIRSDYGWLKRLFSNAPVVTDGMYPQLIEASHEAPTALPAVPEPSEPKTDKPDNSATSPLKFDDSRVPSPNNQPMPISTNQTPARLIPFGNGSGSTPTVRPTIDATRRTATQPAAADRAVKFDDLDGLEFTE